MFSTVNCTSISLLYPEGMLFPFMHWNSVKDNISLLDATPSSFLNENIEKGGSFWYKTILGRDYLIPQVPQVAIQDI